MKSSNHSFSITSNDITLTHELEPDTYPFVQRHTNQLGCLSRDIESQLFSYKYNTIQVATARLTTTITGSLASSTSNHTPHAKAVLKAKTVPTKEDLGVLQVS